MIQFNKKNRGFSILELMIVVTIIGILASVAVQKWREYQSKTRDNIRKLALVQLAKALEVYYMKHRSYPRTGDSWSGYCTAYGSKGFTGTDGYIPGLAPKYIDELPKDPLFDQVTTCTDCGYLYRSDGVNYKLLSNGGPNKVGGPENIPKSGEPFYNPRTTSSSMMISSGDPTADLW